MNNSNGILNFSVFLALCLRGEDVGTPAVPWGTGATPRFRTLRSSTGNTQGLGKRQKGGKVGQLAHAGQRVANFLARIEPSYCPEVLMEHKVIGRKLSSGRRDEVGRKIRRGPFALVRSGEGEWQLRTAL